LHGDTQSDTERAYQGNGKMLTQTQWFIVVMFIGGSIGFHRGWERSLITSTIIVMVTWALFLGTDVYTARLLTHWYVLPHMPSTQEIHAVAAPAYGAIFVWAHWIGSIWGRPGHTKTTDQRWAGIVPGAITGAAFLAYLSHWAAPALFTHNFTKYFPLLFGVAVVFDAFFLFFVARHR
jgi:hypothetical protein